MTTDARAVVDVLTIGEALIDIVNNGSVSTEHPGGSPANVALGLARRGVKVAFLTDLGRDPHGDRILKHLQDSQVQVLPESFSDRPTSTASATLSSDGSASYLFSVQWQLASPALALSPTLVHTGSIAAFLEPGRSGLIAHLDRLDHKTLTFDPNIRPALLGTHAEALDDFIELAARAELVKMSDEDAAWLYPRVPVEEVARAVLRLGPRLVVITRGAAGAVLTTTELEVHAPAVATTAADTIGAGDTYMASLITDVLTIADRPLDERTLALLGSRAAQAAAITVSRAGADLPWHHEVAGLAPFDRFSE